MAEPEAREDTRELFSGQEDFESAWVSLRFLFSNQDAGVIIGVRRDIRRSGSNRGEIQSRTEARLQLSRGGEFYIGTQERVCLISGTLGSVVAALAIVFVKLYRASQGQLGRTTAVWPSTRAAGNEPPSATPPGPSQPALGEPQEDEPPLPDQLPTQLKLLLPAATCGVILGPGGSSVRSTASECNVSISLSPQDRNRDLAYERVATITGPWRGVLKALVLMVSRVLQSPHSATSVSMQRRPAMSSFSTPIATSHQVGQWQGHQGQPTYTVNQLAGQLASTAISTAPVGPASMFMAMQQQQQQQQRQALPGQFPGGTAYYHQPSLLQQLQQPVVEAQHQVLGTPQIEYQTSFPIPDSAVGALIGRGGSVLQQIKELFGVRIVVADRSEINPMTLTRLVRIQGAPEQVQLAQQLIEQRVAVIESRQGSGVQQAPGMPT